MFKVKLRTLVALCLNTLIDGVKFAIHSSILSINNPEKLIALISFNYHSIEKGLSMPEIRYGFGKKRINNKTNYLHPIMKHKIL